MRCEAYSRRCAMSVQSIAQELGGYRSGSSWMARCPAHEDREPSLSLTERNGKVLVKCFAGCQQRDVVEALRARGLWPENLAQSTWNEEKPRRNRAENLGPIVAEYFYTDENGHVLFRVTRHEPKTFRQWRPDGNGGWLPGLGNTRRVLYHLPEVIESPIVFVVEGEKDVESLRSMGFVATCNAMGAGKWRPEYNELFRGRTAIVIPDSDEPGRKHAREVIRGIKPFAAGVMTFDISEDGVKDISEWFSAGHSEVELLTTLERTWQEREGVPRG